MGSPVKEGVADLEVLSESRIPPMLVDAAKKAPSFVSILTVNHRGSTDKDGEVVEEEDDIDITEDDFIMETKFDLPSIQFSDRAYQLMETNSKQKRITKKSCLKGFGLSIANTLRCNHGRESLVPLSHIPQLRLLGSGSQDFQNKCLRDRFCYIGKLIGKVDLNYQDTPASEHGLNKSSNPFFEGSRELFTIMKVILRKDGCLAAISERPVDFTDDNKWIEMDGNAMANFHIALANEVLSSIEEKKTAKEIWDHLTKLYEATSLHNKIFLKRKLYTLRMSESTSVTEHLNTLNTLFSQLTSLRCTIGEQERAELLLQSLSDLYDQLIINLTNSNVISLVFDDVATAVLQEENRRKNKEDKLVNLQQAEALTTMRGRSTEHDQSSSHKHGRSKSRSKKNLKCYNFGKKGHLKKDCWSLNKNSNLQGNTANTSDDGDALCCEASITMECRKRYADIWLIHSCNDHALEIVGVGTIKLKMYDGTIKVVRDVRHVKSLKKNLLSYGLLDNNARKIETRKGIMKVFRGALVELKGEKIDANLYMLKGETLLEEEASVASCSSDSAMLWHQKLGHMSEQGMKVLVEQKLFLGLTKERRHQKTVHSGEHSSTKWSGRADEQNLVRNNKSNVEGCRPRKIILGEAVNTTCYLVNRAPSTAIELKTPIEMWTGKPADYSNLHVFGSIVYVMYNSQEISKLDSKSRKCKFLGKISYKEKKTMIEMKSQRLHKYMSKMSLNKEILLKQNQHMMNKNQRVLKLQQLVNQIVTQQNHIQELKAQLARELEMKDLGSTNKNLGIQIHRDKSNRKIWLSQKNYLKKILSRFSMQDCKPISTPLPINFKLSSSMSPSSEEERMEMSRVPYASAVRSLMFAMICTRPGIAQAMGVVSRYIANPVKNHWNTVKRILRYIKGTSNVELCYGGSNLLINGYVDSDYAGDLDKSKSTTGYVFKVAGGAVSWISKLQSVVVTSTIEAEYVAATQVSKEAIWLKMLLEELGHNQEYVSLFCDTQSALHLVRNLTFHSRTKHIRVQYHFIREKVEEWMVDMQKIHTKDNIVDFMTKAINVDKFTWCRSSCGLSETIQEQVNSIPNGIDQRTDMPGLRCSGRNFLRILKKYTREHSPNMVALLESRISGTKADEVISKLGFKFSYRVEATVFYWYMASLESPTCCRRYGYSSSVYPREGHRCKRKAFWRDLSTIQVVSGTPWIRGGDFNAIIARTEKKSGTRRGSGCKLFQDFLLNNNLSDSGFKGPLFTWNRGGTYERLDRVVAINHWIASTPKLTVFHLLRLKSDHRPILLRSTCKKIFFAGWVCHPLFQNFVCENSKADGNMFHMLELKALEMDIRAKLEDILDNEDLFWKQKARSSWFSKGDRNTRYFHSQAVARRKTNRIQALRISSGELSYDDDVLRCEVTKFFESLYREEG
ncbi:hypothetical protein F3Y22_tig00111208pilonHSYRG00305 [Hibiscus syriacus]|uniref:CCHC-type domain-containing protein n=1 Tax=Hibiscus syriacus TaxID=106335 RepID=A0A6A2YWS2_HIBSY|nr:hypothetical protein F3Y22_tig00111208pilonHSYRG00305 [Hibiscus syriacus]